jgi:rhamnose transport system substrate-binding protein
MHLRTAAVGAVVIAAAAFSASSATTSSSRAGREAYTIAFATEGTAFPPVKAVARGGRAAARRLGDRYIVAGPAVGGPPEAMLPTFRSLIARHVDAIATDGYFPDAKPILTKVREAGITLLASGDDIDARRAVWISQSGPVAYAEALADSLASQVKSRGEYAILRQPGQFPIADEWQHLVAAYVAKTYPRMHLDGVVQGSDPNGMPEPAKVESFMAAHPKLVGFISVVPRGTYAVAEAIEKTGKVGKVFSADNGGISFGAPLPAYVRNRVAELVYASDPVKLGYLTVWAADHLLRGHTFKPGAYQVGGPIGLVWYYARHQELRLGQPFTVTRATVDRYANTF